MAEVETASEQPVAATEEVKLEETAHTNGTAAQGVKHADAKNSQTTSTIKNERDWRERREEDKRKHNTHNQRFQPKRHKYLTKEQKDQYKSNIKTDFTNIAESSDPDEIRKQVEFYFSDSNIFTDKFLLAQTKGSQNVPVPIKIIHNFKRMRHFQPYSAVVAALRDSKILDVVTTSSDEDAIKRKAPLPDSLNINDPRVNKQLYEDAALKRTIYAKGFGQEGPTTQFDIEALFAPFGPTNAIRLRRLEPEKTFKGSVFVEFESEDGAKDFLALEKKPKWGSGADEKELLIMSKEDYIKSKKEKDGKGRSYGSQRRGNRYDDRQGKDKSRGDRNSKDEEDASEKEPQPSTDAEAAAGADVNAEAPSESKKRSHATAEVAYEDKEAKKVKTSDES